MIKAIRQYEQIQKKICRQKMSIMFNEICIDIYIYIYVCVCVCVCTCMFIYTYFLFSFIYICVCVCVCVSACVCVNKMCVYMYICLYTNAYRNIYYIYIYVFTYSSMCHYRGFPWLSLTTCLYHPSLPAGLVGYLLCLQRAAVDKFLLVGQHLLVWIQRRTLLMSSSLLFPAVSSMSCSSNLNGFRDGRQVVV